MRQLLTTIFLLALVSILTPAVTGRAIQSELSSYPGWFWQTPQDSLRLFAVGYARRFTAIDSSFARAGRKAIWQLVRALKVSIEVKQEMLNQFGQSRLLFRSKSEGIDSSLVKTVAAGMCVVDSAVVGNMVLSLASFPGNVKINDLARRTPPSMPPKWLEVLPEDTTAIYALGTSQLYFYEHHSWEQAEANARRQLASILFTRIRSLDLHHDNRLRTLSSAQYSVMLRNVTVVGRWLDLKNRQCYVLCRMPKQ